MQEASLILPHQLYLKSSILRKERLVILAEDPLFFSDERYPILFHKQKLVLHRASMKAFEKSLQEQGFRTLYKDAGTFSYNKLFNELRIQNLYVLDPVDYIANKRIEKACADQNCTLTWEKTDAFLSDVPKDFKRREHYAFTPFYISLRKELDILIERDGTPVGGKWTYDTENRKKASPDLFFPKLPVPERSQFVAEAMLYVQEKFSKNPGQVEPFIYPVAHSDAKKWLKTFIKERLFQFGTYQDAILKEELVMMHALLSPLLNIGLLTPHEVVHEALEYAKEKTIPLNSLEGFLRQVIGWREFVRAVYETSHVRQRKSNFWGHSRKIPQSFYTASTGIAPIDETIKKVHSFAYCHHIERLMILGSFMLLCEFDPDEVYRWFMELFIDSYDWVMVPNVYGMSQYADGGLMTTKPYICSSNYILKMSNYKPGHWCTIWDGLFWRFMKKHKAFFIKQPRLGMLVRQLDKVDKEKLEQAEKFLEGL